MIDKGGLFDKSLQVILHFDINIFLFSQLSKQAYSLLRCICSVIDQRRLQQLRRLEKVFSGTCAHSLHTPYIRCTCQAGRFARAGTRLSAWTTSCMHKVGSSRPRLFHIFQLWVPMFPLPVGELFSNFWWQLRSGGCVCIPIFKISLDGEKLKNNSRKVGFFFHLPYRTFLNLRILKIIPNSM